LIINSRLEIFVGEIYKSSSIKRAFEDVSYVFHLAALARVQPSIKDPLNYNNINVNGTLNLLELSNKHKVKKFVYGSEDAEDFKEFLGLSDLEVKDITVSGSNAAYSYTPHSDVDLHLVVDNPRADISEVYRELFDAKKYQYNDQHDFKIGGYNVELYVQNANDPHHSQGIYSLLNNDWVRVPSRKKPTVNDKNAVNKIENKNGRSI
jgi:hypothetical protein